MAWAKFALPSISELETGERSHSTSAANTRLQRNQGGHWVVEATSLTEEGFSQGNMATCKARTGGGIWWSCGGGVNGTDQLWASKSSLGFVWALPPWTSCHLAAVLTETLPTTLGMLAANPSGEGLSLLDTTERCSSSSSVHAALVCSPPLPQGPVVPCAEWRVLSFS